MTAEEYTPTTVDVATAYQVAGTMRGDYPAHARAGAHYRPEFDRWLAEHDAATERAVRDTIAQQLEKVADRHSDEAARHRADSVEAVTLRDTRSHMATAQAYRNKAEATYDAARTAREGTTP